MIIFRTFINYQTLNDLFIIVLFHLILQRLTKYNQQQHDLLFIIILLLIIYFYITDNLIHTPSKTMF